MSARPETDFVENARRPELIFGLIGALGTDILAVEGVIRDRVTQFGYSVPETIKLTDLFGALSDSRFASVQHGSTKASIEAKMDAGNLLRQITERGEAMAMLGINRIRVIRAAQVAVNGGSPAKTAFIVNSLKHPNEVRSLRRIYGSAFVAVAIYGERAARILATQVRLADFHGSGEPSRYEADAVKLVNRDQDEQLNPYGQHVGEAFALADVVVAASLGRDLKQSTERFLDALFGNWTVTPTIDESGMYHAQGARYRSSSMARQVGAAILRPNDGSIVATGTNDVPRPGGGLYWDSDKEDGRDHARLGHKDSSDFYKKEIVLDFLEILRKLKLLGKYPEGDSMTEMEEHEILPTVNKMLSDKSLKHSKLMATIDYVRAVHAEADAIITAARHGTSICECTLYTTTFPCHDCTKHIVDAGISRVVFVEPYTKSLTSQLFSDSVAIDDPKICGKVQFEPFVGILPRRYADIFEMRADRKSADGMWRQWKAKDAVPSLGDYVIPHEARVITESFEVAQFNDVLREKSLVSLRKDGEDNG